MADYGDHATETPLPLTDDKGTIVYPGFPADVLFNFRFYSVATQLILWSAIGLVFAPMASRLLSPPSAPVAGEIRFRSGRGHRVSADCHCRRRTSAGVSTQSPHVPAPGTR